MAKNYVETNSVLSVQPSGRMFSVVSGVERHNGEFGFLGDYITGSFEIKNFLAPTTDLIGSTATFGIVMQPEMVYDQSTRLSASIDNFKISANDPCVFVPLVKEDVITLSDDLLPAGVVVGDVLVLANNSTKLAKGTKPASGRYIKVISKRPSVSILPYVNSQFRSANTLFMLEICEA